MHYILHPMVKQIKNHLRSVLILITLLLLSSTHDVSLKQVVAQKLLQRKVKTKCAVIKSIAITLSNFEYN
jgi:hypothetical protein